MAKQFALIFLLLLSSFGFSQENNFKYITLDEARTWHPDSVVAIRIFKEKRTEFPKEILNYTNLRALDLTKNRITEIPQELNQLKKLETLILSKNRLGAFPIVLCSMPDLKVLSLSDNPNIGNMPSCIEFAVGLVKLDIFNSGITTFPDELSKLVDLETIDARGIMFGPIFQERWTRLMPNTQIQFDLPCNCIE